MLERLCDESNTPAPTLQDQADRTAEWLGTLVEPGSLVELRAFQHDGRFKTTYVGYYDSDHLDILAAAAQALTLEPTVEGVYWTINPVEPELLARCANRQPDANPKHSTTDADIARRARLFIDLDPVRRGASGKLVGKGISTTDAEKARGLAVAIQIRDHLSGLGWPDPALCDSGNGYVLFYRVGLPVPTTEVDGKAAYDPAADPLIRRCLLALAGRFGDRDVEVDTAVFNPSRIAKVPGTWARKGDSTPDRPHRRSALLESPDTLSVVPIALLEALAAEAPTEPSRRPTAARATPNGGPTARRDDHPAVSQEVEAKTRSAPAARARAYVSKMGPSVDGRGGHKQLFKVAMALVDGFGLGREEALEILGEYNAREDCDPESDRQLEHKVDQATGKVAAQGGPRLGLLGARPARSAVAEPADEGEDEDDVALSIVGVNAAPENPQRLARQFLASGHGHPDGLTLRRWRGEWWAWSGAAWRPATDAAVEAALVAEVEAEFERANRAEVVRRLGTKTPPPPLRPVTTRLVADVMMSLRSAAHLPDDVAQPAWLGPDPAPFPPGRVVLPTRNALVDLESGRETPPTPRYWCGYSLPFDFDPEAPKPTHWLSFLSSIWGDDAESITTLQEWLGYCLTPETDQHKLMFLVGPTRSGKGTIARVLGQLIGPSNVAGPTLAGLATNFGLEPLIGRPLAIVADARLSAKTDRGVITERLLSITGEDTLTIDRKNKLAYTGKLPTRLMLMSNETPWLNDSSQALAGRFLTLHMKKSFEGREDHGLERRLLSELPGVLLWALEGWRRLRDRGRFAQPSSGRPLVDEMRELSSRVGTFLADACEVGPDLSETIPDVFRAWEVWCREQNEANAGSSRALSKDLRTVLPTLTTDGTTRAPGKCASTRNDKSKKLFRGLRLSEEWTDIIRRH